MAIRSDDNVTVLGARIAELERKSSALQWANEAISALASDTGRTMGFEFLQTLTRQLSATLKVRYVFVTEWVPGRTDRVRTVAGWSHDHATDPLEYDLSCTPCRHVIEDGEAFFPHGTRQRFPHDEYLAVHRIESYMGIALVDDAGRPTGHLCIMDERPFAFAHAQGRMIVKVFAARAGIELERLQTEKVIRVTQERLRVLYDDNPSMYFTLAPDATVISVNRHGATQLGYTTDELIGQSVLAVFDPADRQTVLNQLTQCTKNPFHTFEWEIQKVRKDGSRLWVHERARAVLDPDEITTILIVCEDVTEHRRERHLLSTLIQESPLPIISTDHKGRVTSWNPAATKLFGWSEEEVLGRELPYVRPGDEASADEMWDAGLRGEIVSPLQLRRQRKDGTLLDLLLWPVFLRDGSGDIGKAIGIYVDQSELKQAEASRRDSERRLRMIIDSDPEWIKTVSPDGVLMSTNPAGLEMMGAASEQEVLGTSVFPLIHPLDRPTYKEFHQRVCAGETGILAFRCIDLHGKERYLEAHSVPLRDDQGMITGALSITRNITARKLAEDALRASEERFRLIAETVEEVFWSSDPSLEKILYVSPAYERIWGRTSESLYAQPKSFFDAIHADDRARVVNGLTALQQDRVPFGHEYRVVRPDGDVRWVWDRGFPVQDRTTGSLTHYVGVALDITDRKRSEEALAISAAYLNRFVADAPIGLVILDKNRRLIQANKAFCRLTGYAEHEILGRSYELYTHPDDLPTTIVLMDEFYRGLRAEYSLDTRYIRKSGETIWVSAKAVRIELPDCPGPLLLGAIHDVTSQRQATADRTQLSQDLHDNILQSLYAVGMQLEAAKLAGEPSSSRKSKTHITHAINHLNQLVLDVRQFITLLTRHNIAATDFGRTLQQLAASMSTAGQAAPDIAIQDAVLSILTPFQKHQLLNIAREALSNSMRHAQATRRWVTLSRTKDVIHLEIGDDGSGFTARRTLSPGHGLANMAARAKTLRAQFSLHTARGKGTRITVEIPIEKEAPHGDIQNNSLGHRRRSRSRAHRAQRGT
ncbi:MAG: PAS domain S-box protein [Nitrospira sp.]|nr:PAS domain S-box protein [Nitrospira sp.]